MAVPKMSRPVQVLGWTFLAALMVSRMAAAQYDIVTSFDELAAYLQNASIRNDSEVRLRLVSARVYAFTAPLTAVGLWSFSLEGIAADDSSDLPVLSCGNATSSAFILSATVVRIAHLHIRNCRGTGVILQSPGISLSTVVNWSFRHVSFIGNVATAQTVARTSKAVNFTASGLLVPELHGSLSLSNCTFAENDGGSIPVASPALAVYCPPDAVNCSISLTGTSFTGNSGQLASGALLQTDGVGSATMTITASSFDNNTASYIAAMRFIRSPFPPAALLILANGTGPTVIGVSIQDVTFQRSTGSHGLAAIRPVSPDIDNGTIQLYITARNISFVGHSSGPAALLAYGVRAASMYDLLVERNLIPPYNLSRTPVGWVCNGAAACIAIDGPQGSVALHNATFSENAIFDSGALYVTTVARLLRSDLTPRGRLEATDLRVMGTSSVLLGQAGLVSAIAAISIIGGEVRNNSGGGGLAIERAVTITMKNLSFEGNIRGKMTDKQGKPVQDARHGGGLCLSEIGSTHIDGCSFVQNYAAGDGGAVAFVSVNNLQLGDITAVENVAVEGSGGAFSFKGVNETVLNRGLVRSNTARSGDGGALAFMGSGDMAITYAVFDGNSARSSGGAVYIAESYAQNIQFNALNFTRNIARDNPPSSSLSPGGGGAVHARAVQVNIHFANCSMIGNTAPHAAGGALNLQSSSAAKIYGSEFSGNIAGLHGGAIYLGKMDPAGFSIVSFSLLAGNKAGVVYATTSNSSSSSSSNDGGLDVGGGLGGAVYLETSKLFFKCCRLRENVAGRAGGAIAAELKAELEIIGDEDKPKDCDMLLTLPDVPRATSRASTTTAGIVALSATAISPSWTSLEGVKASYGTLLVGNSAAMGGAIYVQDSVLRLQANITDISALESPGVLFVNNSAAVGGAILIYAGREVVIVADFVNNTAVTPAATNSATIGANVAATVQLDDAGIGGAIAVRGSKATMLTMQGSALIGNTAVYGGAVHLAASESCALAAGCYTAKLEGCALVNNTARGGGGGGIFWEHPGLLKLSCPYQKRSATRDDGASATPPDDNQPYLSPPDNSPPLTEPWLPPAALPPSPPAIVAPAPLTYHRAPPAVVIDPQLLPCDSWAGNAAVDSAYGDDVASTGFTLDSSPHYLHFYTSSSPIAVRLSMYDYYGQLCTDNNATAIIRAVSEQVFGQTSTATSRGSAAFTELKLRAESGWHDIDFNAITEYRELSGIGITVYVRPCLIDEYLSPTLDQCLNCSPGSYNFNRTAHQCQPCGPNALCSDPNSPGMIIPEDGYWQSNFFSEQVLSCPNPDACSYPNRTANLSYIHLKVMQLSEAIQASLVKFPYTTTAGNSSNSSSASSAGSSRRLQMQNRLQRLLQRDGGSGDVSNSGLRGAEIRRQLRALLATAVPPLPQPLSSSLLDDNDDAWHENVDDYTLLLRAVGPWLTSYSAAQCSKGYMGVLCGSCAPGYGSTAVAQCRRCPNRTINNGYYALAMLLTAFILAWTIRSLLKQSLLAAHQARGERKVEVMSELRFMGRPIINSSLVAVLDKDELPLVGASQPIYGPTLPPSLEGLVALRKAYQQQQDLDRPSHRGQRQQQQHRAVGVTTRGGYRTTSDCQQGVMTSPMSSYLTGRGGGSSRIMALTAPPPPPPPPPPLPHPLRTRIWSNRRLAGAVVPVDSVPPPALQEPASPAAGNHGCRRELYVGIGTVTDIPSVVASPYLGVLQSVVESSSSAMRPGLTVAVLDREGGSNHSNVGHDRGGTAAAAATTLSTATADGKQLFETSTPVAIQDAVQLTWMTPTPSVGTGDMASGRKAGATAALYGNDAAPEAGVDLIVGEGTHLETQPHWIGPPAHSSGAGAGGNGLRREPFHEESAAATSWAAVARVAVETAATVAGPTEASEMPRPPPTSYLMACSAASGSVQPIVAESRTVLTAAAIRLQPIHSSIIHHHNPRPASFIFSGAEFNPKSLVAPRTASATTAVVGRPCLAGGGSGVGLGLNADFPRHPRSIGGSPCMSPRVASLTGMPPAFLAEVRRRQSKFDVDRTTSRSLLGCTSRLGRGVDDAAAGDVGVPICAAGMGEIEPLRSVSGSTSRSLLSLRGILRRRLGSLTGHGMMGPSVSTAMSLETHRLAIAATTGTGNYGGAGVPCGAGGGADGSGWWSPSAGGGDVRYDEYGVEEFGTCEEVLGTPVVWTRAGDAAPLPEAAVQAAIGAPGGAAAGEGGEGLTNQIRGGNSIDLNPLQDAATIKIFISYVQILALVKAVPIPNPPKSILNYLRFYDQITAIPGSLVSLDCSLPDNLTISKAMQRTILAALAPLYVSVAVAVVWLGIMMRTYHSRRSTAKSRPGLLSFAKVYLPPRLVMSFATVMFYFYPNTVRSLLSIFSCVSVDQRDTENTLAVAAGLHIGKYWTLDYSEQCYAGRHLALALGLGMSGLLLVGVGWPVGVALWLYRKGSEQALDFSDFSMVVYASYREMYEVRYLFWESVIMLRQMLVAVVVVLLAQKGVEVQMLVVIAVVALAFVAQLLVKPFRTRTMNRLEEVTLVVIMITLYLNLYLLSPGVSFTGRTILAACIIGINAAMLVVFVYFITRTSWEKQLDHMGLDRRRVYDMDTNEIRASLRRRYGRRTAAVLTRVVTSARTIKTAKATLYHTGSAVGRSVVSSLKRNEAEAAYAAAGPEEPQKAGDPWGRDDNDNNHNQEEQQPPDFSSGGGGGGSAAVNTGKEAAVRGSTRSRASSGRRGAGGMVRTTDGSGREDEENHPGGMGSGRETNPGDFMKGHVDGLEDEAVELKVARDGYARSDIAGDAEAGGNECTSRLEGVSRRATLGMQLDKED